MAAQEANEPRSNRRGGEGARVRRARKTVLRGIKRPRRFGLTCADFMVMIWPLAVKPMTYVRHIVFITLFALACPSLYATDSFWERMSQGAISLAEIDDFVADPKSHLLDFLSVLGKANDSQLFALADKIVLRDQRRNGVVQAFLNMTEEFGDSVYPEKMLGLIASIANAQLVHQISVEESAREKLSERLVGYSAFTFWKFLNEVIPILPDKLKPHQIEGALWDSLMAPAPRRLGIHTYFANPPSVAVVIQLSVALNVSPWLLAPKLAELLNEGQFDKNWLELHEKYSFGLKKDCVNPFAIAVMVTGKWPAVTKCQTTAEFYARHSDNPFVKLAAAGKFSERGNLNLPTCIDAILSRAPGNSKKKD